RAQHAWEQAGLAEDLEAVADPEDVTAMGRELGHGAHRGREACDRAGAQVVAVREASGQDDGTHLGQLRLRVPVQDRLRAEALECKRGVTVVIRPWEDDDGDPWPRLGHAVSASSIS